MFPSRGGQFNPYKILDISGKNRSQKERMIKTGNSYSGGLYQRRGVVILGGSERELMWMRIRPVGECNSTPIKYLISPAKNGARRANDKNREHL